MFKCVIFCKFYICAVVGVIIEQLDNMHGVTMEISTEIRPSSSKFRFHSADFFLRK